MSGGRAPKQKGNRIERECVNIAKESGIEAKRAWGSDGRSLGWTEEVDVEIKLDKLLYHNQTVDYTDIIVHITHIYI